MSYFLSLPSLSPASALLSKKLSLSFAAVPLSGARSIWHTREGGGGGKEEREKEERLRTCTHTHTEAASAAERLPRPRTKAEGIENEGRDKKPNL